MDSIKNLLSKRIKQSGLARQVGSALIIEEFSKIIIREFGQEIARKVRPLYLKNYILNVACLSSAMSQEINFKKSRIIAELNDKAGAEFIKNIRLII
ncbi:MAG: DUF721 domain-containing protein [Candidatus Parcubacteria bacterium]|nr:DUF721 domain-containing protein [Candidatus Parcubacteria bacterium]